MAIDHLLINNCEFVAYKVSSSGYYVRWADKTKEIYKTKLKNNAINIYASGYYKG